MLRSPLPNITDYDLVLLDNADEPLEVSTKIMYDTLQFCDYSYLISNSILKTPHWLEDKIIRSFGCGDGQNFRDYYSRSFYPQYYDFEVSDNRARKNLVFVNGVNWSWRQHIMQSLINDIPDLPIRSSITQNGTCIATNDCFYESSQDTKFRKWVNDHYTVTRPQEEIQQKNPVWCGINQKFGIIYQSYFLINEYTDYNCIIFPDTGWINHQLVLTEKIIKCFYTKSFPLPAGGSGINQLYNELGFHTAWNLLPSHIQLYDNIDDHQQRYEKFIDAVKWLHNNPGIFETELAQKMLEENFIRVLTEKFALPGVLKLAEILQKTNQTKFL
jgi:hypothetical protein